MRSKNCWITDFCCVLSYWWQCVEKSGQRFKRGDGLHTPALKLKMNGPSSDPKLSCTGAQTKSRAGNKKSWVGLPGFGSVAGEIDIGKDGDFFTDLGTEAEIFRDLHCIVGELRGSGRAIEGMVDADGSKQVQCHLSCNRRILPACLG